MLAAFTDELLRLRPSGLQKTAGILRRPPDRLVERLAATGALSSGALHAGQATKASLTGDYGPEGTFMGALGKGAVGGLLAALGLKALGRMAGRGRLH